MMAERVVDSEVMHEITQLMEKAAALGAANRVPTAILHARLCQILGMPAPHITKNPGNPKLTQELADEIRELYGTMDRDGRWTRKRLAREYGVSHGTISSVVDRRSWL